MQITRIGVCGASSLKGKEILRYFIQQKFNIDNLIPLDLKKHEGKILILEKQKLQIREVKEDNLKNLDLIFFLLEEPFNQKYMQYVGQNFPTIVIDVNNNYGYPYLFEGKIDPDNRFYALTSSVSFAIIKALQPLLNFGKIKNIIYTALQSVSDLGVEAINEIEGQFLDYVNYRVMNANILPLPNASKHYPLALNIIPQTSVFSYETMQSRDEYLQALEIKTMLNNSEMNVFNTTIRVPLIRTECISLYVELEEEFEIFEFISCLQDDIDLLFVDDPLAGEYPLPLTCEGSDKVQVGRLRRVKENAIQLYLVSDNLSNGLGKNAYYCYLSLASSDNEAN